MSSYFNGPLFIVGLSRSGTKLIRDLLNQNESICLPKYESHFIPSILNYNNKSKNYLYRKINDTSYVKKFSKRQISKIEDLEKLCNFKDKTDLIEAVLKYYALDENNENWNPDIIWGDKTPSYLRHLKILNEYFPECKFIHIIRDPRDRAISVHKTWGKSELRATQLWRREISEAIKWRGRKCYKEVRYEELVNNTEKVLKELCNYLGIKYSEKMLTLDQPSEKHGKNSDKVTVGNSSLAKYNIQDKQRIKRIEEVAYPIMLKLDYPPKYAKKFKKLSPFREFIFRFSDHLNFKYNNKIKGY